MIAPGKEAVDPVVFARWSGVQFVWLLIDQRPAILVQCRDDVQSLCRPCDSALADIKDALKAGGRVVVC